MNRQEHKAEPHHAMAQALWPLARLVLFRTTPRWALRGWRRFLLRQFGARIDVGAVIQPTCYISEPWNLTMQPLSCLGDHVRCHSAAPVSLGTQVTVSQNSVIETVTYDTTTPTLTRIVKPVVIEDFAWVAANALIGPGVRVGTRAVIGAGAVVQEDVREGQVVGGNPLRFIRLRPQQQA